MKSLIVEVVMLSIKGRLWKSNIRKGCLDIAVSLVDLEKTMYETEWEWEKYPTFMNKMGGWQKILSPV